MTTTTAKKKLRFGFTTGACAAAAAKAAALLLLTGEKRRRVEIPFPGGGRHSFFPVMYGREGEEAWAAVIKDAGDDPDVTNGAEIISRITRAATASTSGRILFAAGDGVGTVTKPGLVLPVGAPAINPGPRGMIREALAEAMAAAGNRDDFLVTVSVTGGEELAARTLNRRLGIVGGLSILGTTGIVRPVSAAAWTATITASMQVARAAGLDEVVLSTGRTSERVIQRVLGFPEEAYAMMGDYLEFSLQQARTRGFQRIHLAAMWGKVCKAALEIPQTHVRHGPLEPDRLVDFLRRHGLDRSMARGLLGANTAREIHERLTAAGRHDIILMVCERAKRYAQQVSTLPVNLYLIGSGKEVLVRV